jgi:predicted enzyme related to lactoylglutathione lyase
MSERDSYEPGTPSWVDHASGDPAGAAAFYGALFGWTTQDRMPPDAPGHYFMCELRGREVAAVGSHPEEGAQPVWNTYVAVADADAAAERARTAGGTVLDGPFDVFEAGRMAVVRDPGGAVVFLWQAKLMPGARLVDEPGALCWNELTTRDVDGSIAFYRELFGWRAVQLDMGGTRYFTFHLDGDEQPDPQSAIAGLMPMEGEMWPAELPPHWMVYFAVEGADATAARASELGGGTAVAPFDTPAGRIAVLNDPLGAVFSVIELPADG